VPPTGIRNKEEFRKWLRAHVRLGERSVNDVISRATRAARLAPIDTAKSENELAFRLNEAREFRTMTATVRSQVKRAATLYLTFIKNPGGKPAERVRPRGKR
jgi:urease accessory protein UreF